MLLTDKQIEEYIKWFKENYWQYCPIEKDGRLWVPIIYCDDPEKEEERHKQIWLEEIKKLMGKNANKKYVHRGWIEETYAEAQANALFLYHGPYFKHINEKENATK